MSSTAAPSGVVITRASPADAERLEPLFLELRRFSREHHGPQPDALEPVLDATRVYLRTVLARGDEACTFLALTATQQVAGYLVATLEQPNPLTTSGAVLVGSIDELFIASDARGLGAGGALMQAAFDWFREQGALRASVDAYAWNTDAIAFYQRHGLQPFSITLRGDL